MLLNYLFYMKKINSMIIKSKKIFFIFSLMLIITSNYLLARERVVVVGSSTLYPFITISSEIFGYKFPKFKMPVVESNGSGNGIKLFCTGNNLDDPDIAMSSRIMTKDELNNCKQNNVIPIEFVLGYDAIVLVTSKNMNISLTPKELYLAVAKYVPDVQGNPILNPYKKWNEISSSLPSVPIKILGPSSSHGTRDSFIELAIYSVCDDLINSNTLQLNNYSKKQLCKSIRSDDAWNIASDDLNLLIKKISFTNTSIGILSYNFYSQNSDSLNIVKIDNVVPTIDSLKDISYPLVRPLFLYIKTSHLKTLPNVAHFLNEIYSTDSVGKNGYLKNNGLITLSSNKYKIIRDKIAKFDKSDDNNSN